jgi:uncharacterized protein YeaO (DUF488 family)
MEQVSGGMMLKIKRIYEPQDPHDGVRFLVDRLWPRGIRKDDLKMVTWVKEAAPSNELRHWFGHDPEKWDEFQHRYRVELNGNSQSWISILERAQQGDVTLLYSARDAEYNNAVVLKAYLEEQLLSRHAA